MNHKIDGLTGLRGYAALWVMFYHSWVIIIGGMKIPSPAKLLSHKIGFNIHPMVSGWVGVHIFFVLTGFLLFLPFAEKLINPEIKISLSHYFKRRCLRIFPAYYVQMAILAAISAFGLYEIAPWSNWMAHIFMVHNFSRDWTGNINGAWWSLPVEFNFYLALPLFFLLIRKIGIFSFFMGTLITSITYKMAIFPYMAHETVGYKVYVFGQIIGKIDLFAYGMLAAYIYKRYSDKLSNQILVNMFIMGGVIGIWTTLIFINNVGGEVLWGRDIFIYFMDSCLGFFIFFLVLGVCLNTSITKALFHNRLAVYFGNISYGIYLWNLPLLALIFSKPPIKWYIMGTGNHYKMILAVLLFLVSTLIISTTSYYLIERPFLRKT